MDPTLDTFFSDLATRGYEPLLHDVTGTIRFDLDAPEGGLHQWRVAIDHGKVGVSRDAAEADCVISSSEDELTRLFEGQDTVTAAVLRGALTVQGDLTLVQSIRRLSH